MKQGLLVALAFATGLGGAWLYGQLPADAVLSPTVLSASAGCDLGKGACLLQAINDQKAAIRLSPLPLPLMSPIELTLDLHGMAPVRSATVLIEGTNMFMGFQSSTLEVSGQRLKGQFSLPICSNSVMHWQATLDIQTDQQLFRAHIPFTTEH